MSPWFRALVGVLCVVIVSSYLLLNWSTAHAAPPKAKAPAAVVVNVPVYIVHPDTGRMAVMKMDVLGHPETLSCFLIVGFDEIECVRPAKADGPVLYLYRFVARLAPAKSGA